MAGKKAKTDDATLVAIQIRVAPEDLEVIDQARRTYDDLPSRAEVCRRLIRDAAQARSKRKG